MIRFKRIKGDWWPDIELLIRSPSSNFEDGEYRVDDIVIRGVNNKSIIKIPGPSFNIKTHELVKSQRRTSI